MRLSAQVALRQADRLHGRFYIGGHAQKLVVYNTMPLKQYRLQAVENYSGKMHGHGGKNNALKKVFPGYPE